MSITLLAIGGIIFLVTITSLLLTTPAERRHATVDYEVRRIVKDIEEWYPGFLLDDPDYPPRYVEGQDRTIAIPRKDIKSFMYWFYARERITLAPTKGIHKDLGYDYALSYKRCRIPVVIKD